MASSAAELLPPRARGVAARALGVLCVVAMGLALLYIAGGDRTVPNAPLVQPAAPAVEGSPDAPAGLEPVAAAAAAAEAAADPATELGVVVFDRTTGQIAVGTRGDQPYHGAALAKVVLAVDILDRRRLDELQVSRSSIALPQRALGSDDDAMDTLWARFDGPGAAARVSARLDLTGTTAPASRSRWAQMAVPASDVVRIWEYILEQIPPADRDLLVSAVQAAPSIAGDGVDQAFGLLAPQVRGPRAAVAEQAWLCCVDGERYLHSAGAFGPDQRYVAAFLTRVPQDRGWEDTRRDVDAVVEAAIGALA